MDSPREFCQVSRTLDRKNRALNVVHLSSLHSAKDVRIFHKEAVTLAEAGNRVTVIAEAPEDENLAGIQIRAIHPARGRLARMIFTTAGAFRTAWDLHADVYHLHDSELLPWGQLLKTTGARVIFDMHENLPKSILTKPWIAPSLRRLLAWAYATAEKQLLRGMTVILAEQSYAQDYTNLPDKVVVMNLPVLEKLLAISEPHRDIPTAAYMGSVTELRGSLTTLSALKAVQANGLSVAWDCVGNITPAHRLRIEHLASEYGLVDVRVHGYKAPIEGWRIVAKANLGLALLKDIPNYRESYPTKLFEYMALGIPVLVSDFPLYRSVVDRAGCGVCVNPEDVTRIAEAIEWLIIHSDEAREMGLRGKRAVQEHYSWNSEAAKLLALYSGIRSRAPFPDGLEFEKHPATP